MDETTRISILGSLLLGDHRVVTGVMVALGFGLENPDWHRFNDGVLSVEWHGRNERERAYFVVSAVRNPFDRLTTSPGVLSNIGSRAA